MAKVMSAMAMASVKKMLTPLMNQNSASTRGAIVEACSGSSRKPVSIVSDPPNRVARAAGFARQGDALARGRAGCRPLPCPAGDRQGPRRAQPRRQPEQPEDGHGQQPAQAHEVEDGDGVLALHRVVVEAH